MDYAGSRITAKEGALWTTNDFNITHVKQGKVLNPTFSMNNLVKDNGNRLGDGLSKIGITKSSQIKTGGRTTVG